MGVMEMATSKGRSRVGAGLFIGILILALGLIGGALVAGGAPLSAGFYIPDWIDWARISPSMSGLLALGLVLAVIGLIGLISAGLSAQRAPKKRPSPAPRSGSIAEIAPDIMATPIAAASQSVVQAPPQSSPEPAPEPSPEPSPVAHLVADNTRKASLRFEAPAERVSTGSTFSLPAPTPEPTASPETQSSAEIIPFRSEAVAPSSATLSEAPESIAQVSEAQETQAPQPEAVSVEALQIADPIAAALLQEGPEAKTAPEAPADINAVIHSAMRFIQTPTPAGVTSVAEVHAARAEETQSDAPPRGLAPAEATAPLIADLDTPVRSTAEYKALSEALALGGSDGLLSSPLLDSVVLEPTAPSVASQPAAAITEPLSDAMPPVPETVAESEIAPEAAPEPVAEALPEPTPEARIEAAVASALNVWPEATRGIAEGELRARLSQLYHDNTLQSHEAFALAAKGDLSGAARAIETQAREFAAAGTPARAADLWRVFGALHMGRDDAAAMRAYEQVSALDPSDANIHLYLINRYRMAGETDKLLPVLSRALGVVSDRDTRLDLLNPFADLAQKAGHLGHTAQALEEVSQIRAALSAEDPGNLQKRSAQAIALARLAQVRELMGEAQKAAPLYQHAHRVFAELSAQVPDHAGLKAMAENARRDADRLRA